MSYFRDPINFVLVSGLIALVFLGGAAGGGYPCFDGDGMPKEIFEGLLTVASGWSLEARSERSENVF